MEVNKQAHHIFVGKPKQGKPPARKPASNTGNESASIIVADLVTTGFSQAQTVTPPVLPQNQSTPKPEPKQALPQMAKPLPKFDLTDSSNLQSLNNGNLSASPTVIAAVPHDTPEIQWLTDVLDKTPQTKTEIPSVPADTPEIQWLTDVIDKTPQANTEVPSVPADTPEIQWLTQGTGLRSEEPILAEVVAPAEEPIMAEIVAPAEEPVMAEVVRYTDPDLPEIEYLTDWLSKPVSEGIQWGKSRGLEEPIIAEVVPKT